jgi:hypothetical protein
MAPCADTIRMKIHPGQALNPYDDDDEEGYSPSLCESFAEILGR